MLGIGGTGGGQDLQAIASKEQLGAPTNLNKDKG